MKMQSLGRVAGMTALLVLCGSAAGAQEQSAPKASQPAAQEASKDGARPPGVSGMPYVYPAPEPA